METVAYLKLVSVINQLDHHQRTLLTSALTELSNEPRVSELIETHFDNKGACPHCAYNKCYRHGIAHGLQRYRCEACKKTFNALTKTPLAHLRYKEKWLDYLDAMIDSLTVRQAASDLHVHRNTTFRWRHRFLEWIKQDRPTTLHGITEADETYLLESHKGSRKLKRKPRKRGGSVSKRGISNEQVCILIARDRSKQTVDFVTGNGAITKAILTMHLKPILDPDALLISDSNPTYDSFCHAENITHKAVNLSQGQRVIRGLIMCKILMHTIVALNQG